MENRTEKEMEPRMPLTRVQADSGIGLSAAQVQERFAAHADNYKVESSTMSVSDIVKSNVFTYFNLVFLIITILLSIVGAWSDMMFLPIIIANTCIGIIQEVHSKKVLDRLSILNAPHCTVVRDGQEHEVEAHKLVLDDVVVLQAGSQIPADATVLDGELQVNESLITGESDEIAKHAGDELLSGSFVVSGKAHARLEKVGKDSYISKLTLQATQSKKGEQSEMIRSLNYLIMVMGIIIIPIGIALFVQSYIFNEGTLKESITGMVAAIIGMIPEGLYLLSSVAMAVSSVRLAQKKVLIHDMKCIETLARVNVLCVDKTGTITEPGMRHRPLPRSQMWLPRRKKTMRRWRHCRNISRREADIRQKKFFHFLRRQSFPEQQWMTEKPMSLVHRSLYCAASLRNIRNRLQNTAARAIVCSFLENMKVHYQENH